MLQNLKIAESIHVTHFVRQGRIYTDARFDDLHLDARSQWFGKGKNSVLNYFDNQASDKQ